MGSIQGVITGRDVMMNAPLIAREFGFRVLWVAIVAVVKGERVTFLELVMKHS